MEIIYKNEHEDKALAPALDNFTGEIRNNLMGLDPADMGAERARWLLTKIQGLSRAGRPVDLVTIQESLAQDRAANREIPFGCDLAWVVDLAQKSHMTANHAYYVGAVKAMAHRRRLEAAIAQVNDAVARGQSITDAARAIHAEFQRYEALRQSTGPIVIGDLLQGVYEGWRATSDGETVGLQLEVGGLGEAFGLMKGGELVVVAGRPGSGKTELAVTVADDIAIKQERPVLYISLEMNANDMAERFWSTRARLSVDDIQRDVDAVNDHLAEAMAEIAPHGGKSKPLFIQAADLMNADQLTAAATRWAEGQVNPAAVIVDYVGLMELGSGERHDLAIGQVTRNLKLLAKRLDLPVIALFQLSREVEKRANKRPVSADLRDSGAIEQDADKIVMVYRDCVYDPVTPLGNLVELINTKRRRGAPRNGYCAFINGHLAPITNQGMAAEQVTEHLARQPQQSNKGWNK